jgi:hypothetical protein
MSHDAAEIIWEVMSNDTDAYGGFGRSVCCLFTLELEKGVVDLNQQRMTASAPMSIKPMRTGVVASEDALGDRNYFSLNPL